MGAEGHPQRRVRRECPCAHEPQFKMDRRETVVATHHKRPAECHRFSQVLRTRIHLLTSAISLLGSVESPDRFPPHMLRSNTIPEVKTAIYESQLSATHDQNLNRLNTCLYEGRGKRVPLQLQIDDMTARACCIRTDRQRREGEW